MAIELPKIIQRVTLDADVGTGTTRLKAALSDIGPKFQQAQQGADKLKSSTEGMDKSAGDAGRTVGDLGQTTEATGRKAEEAGRSFGGFGSSVRRATGDIDDHNRSQKSLHQNLDQLADRLKIGSLGANVFAESLKFLKAPALLSGVQPLVQGFNALAAGAGGLISAIAPASGILGALPALLGSAGQALGVIKLGFGKDVQTALKDSGKDLKSFEAALQKLTPPAQEFVKQLVGMKPVLTEIKTNVQAALFAPLATGLTNLLRLGPAVNTILVNTAKSIGTIGATLATSFTRGDFISKLTDFGTGNATAISSLGPILANLAKAFLNVGLAAQPMVQRLTEMATSASGFARQATEAGLSTGKLTAFFLRALETGRELGRVIENVVVGLLNIGHAANQGVGESLLQSLVDLTQRFRDFTASTSGQNSLLKYFTDAKPALHELGGLLGDVFKMFGRIGEQGGTSFADLISRIRTGFLPLIEKILVSTGPGFLNALLTLAQTLLQIFASLAGSSGPMVIYVQVLTALSRALNFLIDQVPGVKDLVFVLAALTATNKALNLTGWITGVSSFGRALGQGSQEGEGLLGVLAKLSPSLANASRETAALWSGAGQAARLGAEAEVAAAESVIAKQAAKAAAYEAAKAAIVAAEADEAGAAEAYAAVKIQADAAALAAVKAQAAEYEATLAQEAASAAAAAEATQVGSVAAFVSAAAPIAALAGVLAVAAGGFLAWKSRVDAAAKAARDFKSVIDITKPAVIDFSKGTEKFLGDKKQLDDIERVNQSLAKMGSSVRITTGDFAFAAQGNTASMEKIRQAVLDTAKAGETYVEVWRNGQFVPAASQKDSAALIAQWVKEGDSQKLRIVGNNDLTNSVKKLSEMTRTEIESQLDKLVAEGKLAPAQKDEIERNHLLAGGLQNLDTLNRDVTEAVSLYADQQAIANRTQGEALELQGKLNDLKAAGVSADRELQRAILDQKDAQDRLVKAYLDAQAANNPETQANLARASLDAADANDRVVQSIQAIAKNAADAQASQREFNGQALSESEKTKQGWLDQIDSLEKLRFFTKEGSPLRAAIDGLIGTLKDNLKNAHYNADVEVATDQAIRDVDALISKIQEATAHPYTVRIQGQTFNLPNALDLVGQNQGSAASRPQAGKTGPPKALGGPVSADVAYLVGEKGPELFVSKTAGQIIPNNYTKALLDQTSAGGLLPSTGAVNALTTAFAGQAKSIGATYEQLIEQLDAQGRYTKQASDTVDAINSISDAYANLGAAKADAGTSAADVARLTVEVSALQGEAARLNQEADAAQGRADAAAANVVRSDAAVPSNPTASGQRAAARAAAQAKLDAAAAQKVADDARKAADDAAKAADKAVTDLATAQDKAASSAKAIAEAQKQYEASLASATSAIFDQAEAAVAMKEKQADLSGVELGAAEKVQIHIGALQQLEATLAPDSPLRKNIDDYIAALQSILPLAAQKDATDAAAAQEKAAADKYDQTIAQIDATGRLNDAEQSSAKAQGDLAAAAQKYFLTTKNPKASAADRAAAEDEYQRAVKDSAAALKNAGSAAADLVEKNAALEGRSATTSEKIKAQTDELEKLKKGITDNGVLKAINDLIDRLLAIPTDITTTIHTVHDDGTSSSASTGAPPPPVSTLFLQAKALEAQKQALKDSIPPGKVDLAKLVQAQEIDKKIEALKAQAAGRAFGGPVLKGQPYVVGDGGVPELFVPAVNGVILPRVPSPTLPTVHSPQSFWPQGPAQQAPVKAGPREIIHIDHAEFNDGADIDMLNARAEFHYQRSQA